MAIFHNFIISITKKRTYKIYLDDDLVFYSISFNDLKTNFVTIEDRLYDETAPGIPTFLIFQNQSDGRYQNFTSINTSNLKHRERYALLYYDYRSAFSTNAVSMVQDLSLSKIVIKRHYVTMDK